jgi:hypothetical protein
MRSRSRATRVANLFASLSCLGVLAAGCGPKEVDPPAAIPESPVIQPTRPIHLRAVFDDNPTVYVGRFVPDGMAVEQIDETNAAQTRCSDFYGYNVVNTNQEFDEVAYASTKVGGTIGVKPVAGVTTTNEKGNSLRIHYTLTKRMQVAVKDAAGLDRCCAAAPDQCSKQVIGEFLLGSGEVYQSVGSKAQVEAQGAAKVAASEINFKDEVAWKKVTAFKDMYFAFLTSNAGPGALGKASGGGDDDPSCGWCDKIPTSLDGTYFCGVSPPAPAETMARDLAMRNARDQVVKFLGEYLTSASATEASLLDGYLHDTQVTTAVSSGLASMVKDQKWCKPAVTKTPEGEKLTSKVLAFFPNSEKKKAATTTIEAMIAVKSKDPKHKNDAVVLKALLKKVQ